MEIYLFIIGSRLCRPSRSIPTNTKSGTAIYSNLRNLAQEAIRGKGNQKAPASEHRERGRQLNSVNDRETKKGPGEYPSPLRWELRESNPRPSACKADALNQLS